MELDILAFAAHPDDVELSCAGTLIKHHESGKKTGIIDLTKGELGTRGTPGIRLEEAGKAAVIMGLDVRENLEFRDIFFTNDEEHQLEIVKKIRQYKPKIVLANAIQDRHPDHSRASQLVSQACFMAGLPKLETSHEGVTQKAWRPDRIYHFIQTSYTEPDFVVDISDYFDKKMESIRAYQSQFHNPSSKEPETFISGAQFLDLIRSRAIDLGKMIGVAYAEGFTVERVPGVDNLFDLI